MQALRSRSTLAVLVVVVAATFCLVMNTSAASSSCCGQDEVIMYYSNASHTTVVGRCEIYCPPRTPMCQGSRSSYQVNSFFGCCSC
jgi:hypothetical protein